MAQPTRFPCSGGDGNGANGALPLHPWRDGNGSGASDTLLSFQRHGGNGNGNSADVADDALPLLWRLWRCGSNENYVDGALPSLIGAAATRMARRDGNGADGALPLLARPCGNVNEQPTGFPCSGGSRDVAAMGTARTARSLHFDGSGSVSAMETLPMRSRRSGGSGRAVATGAAAEGATGMVQTAHCTCSSRSGGAATTGMASTARSLCSLGATATGTVQMTHRMGHSPSSGGSGGTTTGTAPTVCSLCSLGATATWTTRYSKQTTAI